MSGSSGQLNACESEETEHQELEQWPPVEELGVCQVAGRWLSRIMEFRASMYKDTMLRRRKESGYEVYCF